MGRDWSWLGGNAVLPRFIIIGFVIVVSYVVWKYILKDDGD